MLGYLRAQRVDEPDDVLGEVFLQVARDIRRFHGSDDDLRRWVFSIAHNRAMDSHRRRARRPVTEPGEVERPVPPPEDPLDADLIAALDTLSPDQREVVVLRFVADLPLDDVAKMTKRKVGAVKALQHRALENLAKRLGPAARRNLG